MSRETSKTLRDVIMGLASRKIAATVYRAKGKPEGVENARDVFLAACAAIAKEFEVHGFRFAKSGPHFSHADGDFTFRVSFQSSYHNISGQHVRLWVHATVTSKRLKDFRKSHLPDNLVNDYVAGGMIHLLLPGDVAMAEWDLADPEARSGVVADVVTLIQGEVLPYFAQFSAPAQLVARLTRESLPAFDMRHSVEFALCFGDKESAQKILSRFLGERPDLQSQIVKVQCEGFRHAHFGPSNYAEQVVYLQREFGLL